MFVCTYSMITDLGKPSFLKKAKLLAIDYITVFWLAILLCTCSGSFLGSNLIVVVIEIYFVVCMYTVVTLCIIVTVLAEDAIKAALNDYKIKRQKKAAGS